MLFELLLAFLCCGSLVVTTVLGLGVTFALERFLGIWAYLVGTLAAVVLFAGVYTVYHIFLRATSCVPADSLACGEPFLLAFALFVGVIFLVFIGNVLAQTALYFFLYSRGQTIPATVYENAGVPPADMGMPGAYADSEYPPQAAEYVDPAYAAQTGEYVDPAYPPPTEPVEPPPADQTYAPPQYDDASQWSGLPPEPPEQGEQPGPPS